MPLSAEKHRGVLEEALLPAKRLRREKKNYVNTTNSNLTPELTLLVSTPESSPEAPPLHPFYLHLFTSVGVQEGQKNDIPSYTCSLISCRRLSESQQDLLIYSLDHDWLHPPLPRRKASQTLLCAPRSCEHSLAQQPAHP